jgi:hypothetical protein
MNDHYLKMLDDIESRDSLQEEARYATPNRQIENQPSSDFMLNNYGNENSDKIKLFKGAYKSEVKIFS